MRANKRSTSEARTKPIYAAEGALEPVDWTEKVSLSERHAAMA
jgi:hypothetical protein